MTIVDMGYAASMLIHLNVLRRFPSVHTCQTTGTIAQGIPESNDDDQLFAEQPVVTVTVTKSDIACQASNSTLR